MKAVVSLISSSFHLSFVNKRATEFFKFNFVSRHFTESVYFAEGVGVAGRQEERLQLVFYYNTWDESGSGRT